MDGRLGEPAQARRPATTGACSSWARRARCVGFDIDTNHFLGNHPPFASVEGCSAPRGTPLEALRRACAWSELLAQSPLRPGSQNLFARDRGERR